MFETAFTIEWGDCDEAGIVFYPNYFYWFDCTYQRWLRKLSLSQRELRRRFKSVTPLVDDGAQIMGPARYDDDFQVRAEVSERRGSVVVVCDQLRALGAGPGAGHGAD